MQSVESSQHAKVVNLTIFNMDWASRQKQKSNYDRLYDNMEITECERNGVYSLKCLQEMETLHMYFRKNFNEEIYVTTM